jgi:5-methylcytosine-specific restriction enzyme subunit McrC
MRRVQLREYERLRSDPAAPDSHRIPADLLASLERWDRLQAARRPPTKRGEPAPTVFDWSIPGVAYAKNQWVGVLEVPGLSVELLPKLDSAAHAPVRANLLHMLSISGMVRHLSADLAALAASDAPLHHLFISLFATRLLSELQRGVQRGYSDREEPLGSIRGRLLVRQQARQGKAAMHRVWCAFDEFDADIQLNRALRAACAVLLDMSLPAHIAATLRRADSMLDDVPRALVTPQHIDAIPRTRQTARWEPLLAFARLILADQSPDPSSGDARCFSLLFLMWELFESFVASLLQTYILPDTDLTLHPQGAGFPQHALFWERGKPLGELLPDVLLARAGQPVFILDTKWKELGPQDQPSNDNLQQLHGYATGYGVSSVCLLYPQSSPAPLRRVAHDKRHGVSLHIRSLDLSVDLGDPAALAALCGELRDLIPASPPPAHPPAATTLAPAGSPPPTASAPPAAPQ